MHRLEKLKKELSQIKTMDCLAFNIKEQAEQYYNHEIECIEKFGSSNPDYSTKIEVAETEIVKVTIEESASQQFEIEARQIKDIPKMYKDGQLVVENGELTDVHFMIEYGNGSMTDWEDMD